MTVYFYQHLSATVLLMIMHFYLKRQYADERKAFRNHRIHLKLMRVICFFGFFITAGWAAKLMESLYLENNFTGYVEFFYYFFSIFTHLWFATNQLD